MDPRFVEKVNQQVYRRHPEFSGCRPKVRRQAAPEGSAENMEPLYLFTYTFQAPVESSRGARSLTRTLRVSTDDRGRIIKISTAR